MKSIKKIFLFSILFIVIFIINLSFAQILKEYDIYNIVGNEVDSKKFYVASFYRNTPKLLAIAPVSDIKLKKENKNYALFFIDINNEKIDKIYIPMYNIQQILFDQQDKNLFLIGNNLTTLSIINLDNYNYKEISKVEYGKKSFRFKGLIWYENNEIFADGYYLDEKQNASDDFIVKLSFENNNVNFINTNFNLTSIEKKFDLSNLVILNHNQVALVAREKSKSRKLLLGIVNKEMELKKIDEGDTFSSLSFSNDYILYAGKKANKIYYSLYNYREDKIILTKEIDFFASYNFISKNSESIILGNFKPKTSKMDVYLGKKQTDYVLNKIIEDEVIGYMKVSYNGEYLAYCSKTGKIKIYKI